MYAEGRGTEQDTDKAWEILKAMQEDGEGYDMHWGYVMGKMYENGYGVEKNMEMAEKYYEEARRIELELEMNDME